MRNLGWRRREGKKKEEIKEEERDMPGTEDTQSPVSRGDSRNVRYTKRMKGKNSQGKHKEKQNKIKAKPRLSIQIE